MLIVIIKTDPLIWSNMQCCQLVVVTTLWCHLVLNFHKPYIASSGHYARSIILKTLICLLPFYFAAQ